MAEPVVGPTHIVVRGAREHNLRGIEVDHPARPAGGDHRSLGLGEILPGLRHPLCRRPAALRGVALRLRPAVPRPDDQAGGRVDRRPLPRHLDRAAHVGPQPALHRRHHDGGLRLPAPALGAGRKTALLVVRAAHRASDRAADDRSRARPRRGHAGAGAGAGGAGPEGRVPQGAGRVPPAGLRARADRRRAGRSLGGHQARQAEDPRDRPGGGSPAGQGDASVRASPAPSRPRCASATASSRSTRAAKTRAGCSRSAAPAPTAASRSPRSRRVPSRSTVPTAPARAATASAPATRSIPISSCPTRSGRWRAAPSIPGAGGGCRATTPSSWKRWRSISASPSTFRGESFPSARARRSSSASAARRFRSSSSAAAGSRRCAGAGTACWASCSAASTLGAQSDWRASWRSTRVRGPATNAGARGSLSRRAACAWATSPSTSSPRSRSTRRAPGSKAWCSKPETRSSRSAWSRRSSTACVSSRTWASPISPSTGRAPRSRAARASASASPRRWARA